MSVPYERGAENAKAFCVNKQRVGQLGYRDVPLFRWVLKPQISDYLQISRLLKGWLVMYLLFKKAKLLNVMECVVQFLFKSEQGPILHLLRCIRELSMTKQKFQRHIINDIKRVF
ncbi:UNVERIFIED_ORG: hypothetical protein C7429_103389 [Pantoea allii]